MNFKQLTDEQVDNIKKVYHDNSGLSWEKKAFKLAEKFGVKEQ